MVSEDWECVDLLLFSESANLSINFPIIHRNVFTKNKVTQSKSCWCEIKWKRLCVFVVMIIFRLKSFSP